MPPVAVGFALILLASSSDSTSRWLDEPAAEKDMVLSVASFSDVMALSVRAYQ